MISNNASHPDRSGWRADAFSLRVTGLIFDAAEQTDATGLIT